MYKDTNKKSSLYFCPSKTLMFYSDLANIFTVLQPGEKDYIGTLVG